MIHRKIRTLADRLIVVVGLSLLLWSGCGRREVHRPKPGHLPIHLAVGTFDPLSESGPIDLPTELTLTSYPRGEAGYYILQFKGPVQEEWKKAVLSAGARLFDYVPDFAFLVKMDRRTRKFVQAMESVRWIGIYQPGYRIAPDLRPSLTEKDDRPLDVTVSIFDGEDVSGLVAGIGRLGGEVLEISHRKERIKVRLSFNRIAPLSRLNGVKWIERVPEPKIFPSTSRRVGE